MTGPKIKSVAKAVTAPPVTREALESFIWAATGWRGDAGVIDAILNRIDDHVSLKVSEVDTAPAAIDHATARIVELSAELNAEHAALREALDTVRRLSGELNELKANPPAGVVERTTVAEILELLATATLEAGNAVGTSTRTLTTLTAVTDALRAADGLVKDIRLTNQTAERRADPEQLADDEPAAQTIALEIVTDGDAQTARALGYVIATEHIEQAEADRLMEQEAASLPDGEPTEPGVMEQFVAAFEADHGPITAQDYAEADALLESMAGGAQQDGADERERELPASVGLGQGPGDLSQREGFGDGAAEPQPQAEADELTEEEQEMAAMIVEIEAEILATGRGATCTRCGNVKVWEHYHVDKQAANGHKGACKGCESERVKQRRREQMRAGATAPTQG